MPWPASRSKTRLYAQMYALGEKVKLLNSSPYHSDRRKAWKLMAKIKRLERELENRQLPIWSARL